jgi:hypothetical protein
VVGDCFLAETIFLSYTSSWMFQLSACHTFHALPLLFSRDGLIACDAVRVGRGREGSPGLKNNFPKPKKRSLFFPQKAPKNKNESSIPLETCRPFTTGVVQK